MPAVWIPPSSTGLSWLKPSSVVSRRPWSRLTMWRSLVGCFCSSSTGASIGEISRSKRPSSQARLALALGAEAERVDVVAGDAAALGDPLGGGELVGQIDVPRLGPQDAAVGTRVGAEADAAHRLDSARDADVDGTRRDQAGDEAVGLLAAAALAVDGHGADVLGQPGDEPAHPGDVVGLLAELRHAAADDLLDVAGVDAGLLHQRLLHRPQQLGGVQSGQPSVAFADRAAGGFNDYRVTHGVRLEHVSLL